MFNLNTVWAKKTDHLKNNTVQVVMTLYVRERSLYLIRSLILSQFRE